MRLVVHNYFPARRPRARDAEEFTPYNWEVEFIGAGPGAPAYHRVKVQAYTRAEAQEKAQAEFKGGSRWKMSGAKNLGRDTSVDRGARGPRGRDADFKKAEWDRWIARVDQLAKADGIKRGVGALLLTELLRSFEAGKTSEEAWKLFKGARDTSVVLQKPTRQMTRKEIEAELATSPSSNGFGFPGGKVRYQALKTALAEKNHFGEDARRVSDCAGSCGCSRCRTYRKAAARDATLLVTLKNVGGDRLIISKSTGEGRSTAAENELRRVVEVEVNRSPEHSKYGPWTVSSSAWS